VAGVRGGGGAAPVLLERVVPEAGVLGAHLAVEAAQGRRGELVVARGGEVDGDGVGGVRGGGGAGAAGPGDGADVPLAAGDGVAADEGEGVGFVRGWWEGDGEEGVGA